MGLDEQTPSAPRGHGRLVPSRTDQRRVRRDLVRALRALHPGPADAAALGRGDAVLPRPGPGRLGHRGPAHARDHGRRLAELFTDAKLVEIEDSYTLIPEDQPQQLARELREFVKVS
jgi:hypothetical protein